MPPIAHRRIRQAEATNVLRKSGVSFNLGELLILPIANDRRRWEPRAGRPLPP